MQESAPFSEEELTLPRVCEICASTYTLEEAGEHFFSRPYNYRNGCATTCLTCWLDCAPPRDRSLTGNLLREFATKLSPDSHLVVMPVHRLMFSEPIEFQSGSIIYPRGIAKLAALKLEMSKEISESLSFYQSTATFVDRETLSQTPTIAFTYSFDWDGLWHGSHKSHMEFIGIFSQIADSKCLNWIRYKFCTIDMPDVLPSRAGQTKKDPGMSAALLYNAFRREGGIIAGDAFNSVLTRGLGLPLNEDDKRLRLLPTAPRSAAGYRLFPAQALDRVRLIRGALAIGFSVRELTTIFAERDRSGTPCRRVLLLAREKLATVEASLRNLQIWRRELKTTLVGWERRLRKTPRGQRAGLLEAFVASHPNRQTRNSSRMPLARGHQKREESQ